MALGAGCVSDESVPPLERRAQGLNRTVMCPVCPGESIDQSQNPLAVQMRGVVKEKMEQGWSDARIRDLFVEGYGPSVLLEPPRRGFNLVAWVLPGAAVTGAVTALYIVLRMMRRPRPEAPDDVLTPVELSDEERARYRRLLDRALGDGHDTVAGRSEGDGGAG